MHEKKKKKHRNNVTYLCLLSSEYENKSILLMPNEKKNQIKKSRHFDVI